MSREFIKKIAYKIFKEDINSLPEQEIAIHKVRLLLAELHEADYHYSKSGSHFSRESLNDMKMILKALLDNP